MEHFYKRPLPEPGEKWRHFKGNVYKIICIAEDTERLNPVIVYQGVDDCAYWARPFGMFMSEVDHEKYPGATQKWRFEKVADADE